MRPRRSSVGGSAPFTVQTDGTGLNTGDAVKTYVNAKISITPNATNEVGQPHTFTVTLKKDTGTGGFVAAADEHVDCHADRLERRRRTRRGDRHLHDAGANTNASGQCTITFTSPTAGKVTGARDLDALSVGGRRRSPSQTDGIERQLGRRGQDVRRREHPDHAADGHEPGRRDARVHGARQRERRRRRGFVNAPAGTSISFTIVSGPGSFTTANPCTTVGTTGSCTVTPRSRPTTGTTVVSAHVTTLGRRRLADAAHERRPAGTPARPRSSGPTRAVRTDIHDTSSQRDHDRASGHVRPRQGVRDEAGRHAGGGAEPDGQRRLPPLRDGQLHRRGGRPDGRARRRRDGRVERVHRDLRHVLQGRLRRRCELPGPLRRL